MVTEAPELPSSQGCTEYTAKHGATSLREVQKPAE